MRGQDRCRMHGGASPQAREAAKRRLALQAARRKLADVDVEPIGDPFVALEQLAGEAMTLRGLLAERVAAIEDEPAAKPADRRAEWQAYGEALDRAERFVSHLTALGLDERRVALSERQADVIVGVLRAAVAALFGVLRERLGDSAFPVLDAVERDELPGLLRAELESVEVRQ